MAPRACSVAIRALQPVPVGERSILPGRTTTALAPVSVSPSRVERAGELAERDMVPVRVERMGKAELGVGGGGDPDPGLGEFARFVGADGEAERRGVDDDKAVAAIGDVDAQRSEARNFKRRVEPRRERGHVLDMDALGLAVAAVGDDLDHAARRLQRQPGLRLLHRHDAAVEQHGRDADRVRTRHRRRVLGLHDDEAHPGARVLGRDEQVDVAEHAAARLVEQELAQGARRGR